MRYHHQCVYHLHEFQLHALSLIAVSAIGSVNVHILCFHFFPFFNGYCDAPVSGDFCCLWLIFLVRGWEIFTKEVLPHQVTNHLTASVIRPLVFAVILWLMSDIDVQREYFGMRFYHLSVIWWCIIMQSAVSRVDVLSPGALCLDVHTKNHLQSCCSSTV